MSKTLARALAERRALRGFVNPLSGEVAWVRCSQCSQDVRVERSHADPQRVVLGRLTTALAGHLRRGCRPA